MEFHIGDPVMHWMYGFGYVAEIEERIISGQANLYYSISMRDLTIWVPADANLGSRLRLPTPKDGFKALFAILIGPGEPLPDDRYERKTSLANKLKDGQATSICHVLRDLTSFRQKHILNDSDLITLKRSQDMLIGEWGHALSVSASEAEAELRRLLAVGKTSEI